MPRPLLAPLLVVLSLVLAAPPAGAATCAGTLAAKFAKLTRTYMKLMQRCRELYVHCRDALAVPTLKPYPATCR